MHETAMISGSLFGKVYGKEGMSVLDVGGQDINGSLRKPFEVLMKLKYTCLDIEKHPSVDVVMNPGDNFPFPDESFDLIVSTSCFEHDPCFWITFREMCRVVKKSGYIYVNAPSNGPYHNHPGDNWRFYSDAGQALAYWSGKTLDNKSFPVQVQETFHILPPPGEIWIDFVTIWKRSDNKENSIVLSDEVRYKMGLLRSALDTTNYKTQAIIYKS